MAIRLKVLLAGFIAVALLHSPAFARIEIIFQSNGNVTKAKQALDSGQLDDAAYFYEKALAQDLSARERVRAHNGLCVTYMYLGQYREAIEQCEMGIRLKPNRWQLYNNLGNVYIIQGDYQSAIEVFEKALEKNSGSRILQFNLGIALQRAGLSREDRPVKTDKNKPEENWYQDHGFPSSNAG